MTEKEVVALMRSSESEQEWNANCDKVVAAYDGYPPFWYQAVILSDLASEVAAKWNGDAEIHVTVFSTVPNA